jgi:anti-sigma-K factor RskA
VTGRVLHLDPAAHKVADVLLPWFVNGTLEGDELAFVQRHVERCVRCQREVEWLRDLHFSCVAAEATSGSPGALRNLRHKLEEPRAKPDAATPLRALWSRVRPWSHWVAAAEFAVIVVLGVWLLPAGDGPALYRTLGASNAKAPSNASLVVVFDPATTEAELRRIVRDAGARIVDGPTQANAYLLDVAPQRQDEVIKAMRGERAAVLVERLGPAVAR